MTIEQCYEKLGGDFQKICRRLPGRQFVERFVGRYLEDDSANMLFASVKSGDMEEAFRHTLSLKGVAGNLGFENLERTAEALAYAIRQGRSASEISRLAEYVEQHHMTAVKLIRLYLEEKKKM